MRPLTIWLILAICVLIVFPNTTVTAEQFGLVSIELGEDKQTVLKRLSMYEVLDGGNVVAVIAKPNSDYVGSLWFKDNNRLESINKEWASFKDINQGKLIANIIEMYTKGSEVSALVNVTRKSNAKVQYSRINIKLLTNPMRTIEITIFESPKQSLSISENIE